MKKINKKNIILNNYYCPHLFTNLYFIDSLNITLDLLQRYANDHN